MFNAKQPGSKTDYEKLNHLLKGCNSVLIVLNQKDLIKESEQTMEEVVDTLKKNYSKWFDTKDLPEIFPISAYQALVARSARSLDYNGKDNFSESERKQLLDSSEIEKFEDRLTKISHTRREGAQGIAESGGESPHVSSGNRGFTVGTHRRTD